MYRKSKLKKTFDFAYENSIMVIICTKMIKVVKKKVKVSIFRNMIQLFPTQYL